MTNITIPKSGSQDTETIQVENSIIVVGSNGSGKSRFGYKLEDINASSYRISAQRNLRLQATIPRENFQTSRDQFYGRGRLDPIEIQDDYVQLLMVLFAEEADRNEKYVELAQNSKEKPKMLISAKEKVLSVWDFIFSSRPLNLKNNKILATNNNQEFSGTQLSDGEKVGFYLIVQTLLAKENSLLIIDEPELHLHKALMVRLWNKLEESRPDCTFVYITHDLDFAASKPASKLIWVKSFLNNIWDFELIESSGIMPQNLYLEVLGSRQPILFVEGNNGSLDSQIYQAYYTNFTVIPCGSCDKVKEAVKGLRAHPNTHHKEVFGLIDRDFKSENELESLRKAGVFSIPLNQIENLFLVPEVLAIVGSHMGQEGKGEEQLSKINDIYLKKIDTISLAVAKSKLDGYLQSVYNAIKTKRDYELFYENIGGNLPTLEEPNKNADIIDILKLYPHKGLLAEVKPYGLPKKTYEDLVLSFFRSDKKQTLINALKPYLPEIEINPIEFDGIKSQAVLNPETQP